MSGSPVPSSPSPLPPMAELHLHIEGTLEPELIFDLAARNGISLPYQDVNDLRARYEFTDLQSFLDLYYANMAVLVTEEDFATMTTGYLRRAATAGVRHAEIFIDPQAHLARGVDLATSIGGVARALATSRADFGMSTSLIAAFLRDQPADEALAVLEDLIAMDAPIIGIGLDSAEVGHPPSEFTQVFDRAREAGLECVAHAGEEGPPAYISEALDVLHVSRIDHGIRAMEDDELVLRLVEEQVPMTVCPLSNVRLRAVTDLAAHPLPRMIEAGLNVSIHSDDPSYFGGYLDDNLDRVTSTFELSQATLALLAANSIRSSFLPEQRQGELLAEVEAWLSE
ncbi:adenosine deaminase [Arthrobacter sp. JSM 101049]|uniref:adenosine deaminase n=1 Tax=Arthrobacter sp. JSM 101049 TaxID=929097 RepID=UPI0035647A9A